MQNSAAVHGDAAGNNLAAVLQIYAFLLSFPQADGTYGWHILTAHTAGAHIDGTCGWHMRLAHMDGTCGWHMLTAHTAGTSGQDGLDY